MDSLVSGLRTRGLPPGSAVLAAHPDDETAFAGVLLCRSPGARVFHLTDGAPRDTSLWPRAYEGGRDEYAAVRRREAEAALAIAGVSPERIECLFGVDQEAIDSAVRLARTLAERLRALRPPALVLHALEGGHPDHDAAALVGRAAAALAGDAAPILVEMPSYHARGTDLAIAEFLPSSQPQVELELEPEAQERKERMIAAYESQAAVLQRLPVVRERFRAAADIRFADPPHEGPLFYEQKGWRGGAEWRALARSALEELRLWSRLG
jgi:N-acetylglucosamine malate deacetylase 2